MYTMDQMTVIRGIPKAKPGGVDVGDKGMGGKNVNADSQDTTEEYIAGMSDREYVLQIISSPVKVEHLERWLAQTAKENRLAESCQQRTADLEQYVKKTSWLQREFDEELVRRLIRVIKVVNENKLEIQFHSGIVLVQRMDFEE